MSITINSKTITITLVQVHFLSIPEDGNLFIFEECPPISTYIYSLAVGPYKEFTNTSVTSTFSREEVAVAEISPKCHEMSTFVKVMGHSTMAVSTHSVSEMRQINMAGNI